MSKFEALTELKELEAAGQVLIEGAADEHQVSLDGWDPDVGKVNGAVVGVVVRYWESGTKAFGEPSGGSAPDRLDPRNALALVRLCQWLKDNYGVTELYHLGISGGGVTASGAPRTDCHGQGRAVDFMGVSGEIDGTAFTLTVNDDWGTAETVMTPGGAWPDGTGSDVSYRLDDPAAEPFTAGFFRDVYAFIASEWQDRSAGPDGLEEPTTIGERSFVMHPDHPATAPGTAHGREAHANHIHMQIGVTGTEH
jgi:hypothetical protein